MSTFFTTKVNLKTHKIPLRQTPLLDIFYMTRQTCKIDVGFCRPYPASYWGYKAALTQATPYQGDVSSILYIIQKKKKINVSEEDKERIQNEKNISSDTNVL